MTQEETHRAILATIDAQEGALLEGWLDVQRRHEMRPELAHGEVVLHRQSTAFIKLLALALRSSCAPEHVTDEWRRLFDLVSEVATNQARGGATVVETNAFLSAIKRPLLDQLATYLLGAGEIDKLADAGWWTSVLIDELINHATTTYIDERDATIRRQRADLAELSTPVLHLWEDIIVMPLVGTLDSRRAQGVMDELLASVETHSAKVAILDITGVPTVDTLVAQHLFKTAAAARLMGTECLISGVGAQIARTIVELGIDFGHIPTRSSLRAALTTAFSLTHSKVVRVDDEAGS